MKVKFKYCKFFLVFLMLIFTNFKAYAANVISASNTNYINILDAFVVSSNQGYENFTKISDVSVIKFTDANNNYFSGSLAKAVSNNDEVKINVYEKPNTESNVIGKISEGLSIIASGQSGDFVEILFNDNKGFILKQNLQIINQAKDSSTSLSDSNYIKVTSEVGVNLREENNTSSIVLATLPFDSSAIVLEVLEDWVKVKYNDMIGYVSASFVNIVSKEDLNSDQNLNDFNFNDTNLNIDADAAEIIEFAKKYLGKPYIYGSTNLEIGTDCSGFTFSIFKNFGVKLNRVSRDQFLNGESVEPEDLKPADLIFFNTGGDSAISHVGMYIGNGEYIHSTDTKDQGVIISSLNTSYAKKCFVGARRII